MDDDVNRYNLKEDVWHDFAPLPEPRNGQMLVVGGRLWIIGGFQRTMYELRTENRNSI